VVGLDKIHAWFNHWPDLAAKEALAGHATTLYTHMVKDYRRMMSLAKDIYSFQAGVALIFANDGDAREVRQQVWIGDVHPVGLLSSLRFEDDIQPVVCHQGFARSLINWMREIRWTSTTSVDGLGSLQDTSWLELFWGYDMFMIRRRSVPFGTIMNGFGFRMTPLWSSQFHPS
jgi:hypothetical protein